MTRKTILGIAALPLLFLLMIGFVACDKMAGTDKAVEPTPAATVDGGGLPKSAEPRDPNRLWCNEHNVYEDECVLCHPELANKKKAAEERDPNRLWCNEHNVYEDECVLCHPELGKKPPAGGAADSEPAVSAEEPKSSAVLLCKEHRMSEEECGICHPELVAVAPVGKGMKVRLPSENSTVKAGISTALPSASSQGASDELLGQVSFNRNALAMVTPLAGGVVRQVFKDVGDAVSAGDVLATVQSLDVAQAKSELMKALAEAELARQTLAREQDLFERKISPRRDLEQAQAAVKITQSDVTESRQHLLNLGLSQEDVDSLAKKGAADSSLTIRAPFAGTVIERNAVVGSAVEPGNALFQVADLSSMWMEVSVQESKLSSFEVGAQAQARFDAYPGIAFEGEVNWVAPSVNSQTRMVQARLLLKNPQGLLRDGLFGRATLSGAAGGAEVAVPTGAVQDIDGRSVVFKKLASDLFEARVVALGSAVDGRVAVLAGLSAQDEIVIAGSYTMKSELLKAKLGAGCADE